MGKFFVLKIDTILVELSCLGKFFVLKIDTIVVELSCLGKFFVLNSSDDFFKGSHFSYCIN